MRYKQGGFTVLELIIAMTIAAILLGVGIPSFINTIRTNRLAGATNELVSALMYARSEAVKRNLPVVMCRSSDGANCAAAGTGGWEIGWMVYVNTTGNPILNVHEALNSSLSAVGNNNVINQVAFNSLGLMPGGMGAIKVKFTDDTTDSNVRYICVASSGRPRLIPKGSAACTS
jgi:type IV fimbrial biogenesis protein FimT